VRAGRVRALHSAGNISDPESFKTAITRVRADFGIEQLIMVGDRGMITGARIDDLRKLHCMGWITALKAPANAALAKDDGPLQMSLLDTSPRSLTPIIPANG